MLGTRRRGSSESGVAASSASRASGRRHAGRDRARSRRVVAGRCSGPNGYTRLGATGLTVSRLGFGSYRVDDRVAEHREALTHALTHGINLIDTSTNYGSGHSERLIGEVLAELRSAARRRACGRRRRLEDRVRAGWESRARGRAREDAGQPFPEVVKVGEGIWHCIHPEWIEEQLELSSGGSVSKRSTCACCTTRNISWAMLRNAGCRPPKRARNTTDASRRRSATSRPRSRAGAFGRTASRATPSVDAGRRIPEATSLERLLAAARAAGRRRASLPRASVADEFARTRRPRSSSNTGGRAGARTASTWRAAAGRRRARQSPAQRDRRRPADPASRTRPSRCGRAVVRGAARGRQGARGGVRPDDRAVHSGAEGQRRSPRGFLPLGRAAGRHRRGARQSTSSGGTWSRGPSRRGSCEPWSALDRERSRVRSPSAFTPGRTVT